MGNQDVAWPGQPCPGCDSSRGHGGGGCGLWVPVGKPVRQPQCPLRHRMGALHHFPRSPVSPYSVASITPQDPSIIPTRVLPHHTLGPLHRRGSPWPRWLPPAPGARCCRGRGSLSRCSLALHSPARGSLEESGGAGRALGPGEPGLGALLRPIGVLGLFPHGTAAASRHPPQCCPRCHPCPFPAGKSHGERGSVPAGACSHISAPIPSPVFPMAKPSRCSPGRHPHLRAWGHSVALPQACHDRGGPGTTGMAKEQGKRLCGASPGSEQGWATCRDAGCSQSRMH